MHFYSLKYFSANQKVYVYMQSNKLKTMCVNK